MEVFDTLIKILENIECVLNDWMIFICSFMIFGFRFLLCIQISLRAGLVYVGSY